MEMRYQNDPSTFFNTPEKFEKDSPIDMTIHSVDNEDSKRSKTPHKQLILTIMDRITNLQRRIKQLQQTAVQAIRKKKKLRRRAKDIHRDYKCSYSTCEKVYGSKTSLKNHMKLKHGYRMRRYVLQNKQNRSE